MTKKLDELREPASEAVFKEIDACVHKELDEYYTLEMLAAFLAKLIKSNRFSKKECIGYLYAYHNSVKYYAILAGDHLEEELRS